MKRRFSNSRKWRRGKSSGDDEALDALNIPPIHAFALDVECPKLLCPFSKKKLLKKHKLPSTADLCQEESFANVSMGWSEEGIFVSATICKPFQKASLSDVKRGDGLELFFDTRDVKNAGFNHRFCHHFVFLPKEGGDVAASEVTRFRTEDSHELCSEKSLQSGVEFQEKSYTIDAWISKKCLHGFDPEFGRMGFTYRINRLQGPPQHFCLHSADLSIEYHPSLWSTVRFIA